ncbi:MAG TPA: MFS transporter [Roseiarcus sp.]|nr:MFS transporter [Roseiarcus sp.]
MSADISSSMPPSSMSSSNVAPSRWGPFGNVAFMAIWTSSIIANVGLAIFDTGSGWLMTSLDAHPMAVSLVQVATTLPMFLITLPAGALTDIIDARKLLIGVQLAIVVVAVVFATVVSIHEATPTALLTANFLLGASGALMSPAWLAITPMLVSREELDGATAANSVGYNLSRAVGPALGGVAIATLGIAAPFWIFGIFGVGVIAALLWWRPRRKCSKGLPAERFTSAIRTGLRYAANNRHLRATLIRALAFFPFASAYWALLPLVARHQMNNGPEVYGALLGAIGAGAIGGSFALTWLKAQIGPDRLGALGALGTALALGLFAVAREPIVALCASAIAGASWTVALATLYVSAQVALPDWVRGRGLAVFLTVYFGAMTAGSAAWGEIAGFEGLSTALLIAAVGAIVAVPLTWRWKLQTAAGLDLTPAMHWRAPVFAVKVENDQGPILVTVEYRIEAKERTAFLEAIDEIGQERKRDGAFAWGVFEDAAVTGRYVETFLIESWLELRHLRERVTNADRMLEEQIRRLLISPPQVTFLVAATERRNRHRQRSWGRRAPEQLPAPEPTPQPASATQAAA